MERFSKIISKFYEKASKYHPQIKDQNSTDLSQKPKRIVEKIAIKGDEIKKKILNLFLKN